MVCRCNDTASFDIVALISDPPEEIEILSHDAVCTPSYTAGRCPRYLFLHLIRLHTTKLTISTCINPLIAILKAMHRSMIERTVRCVRPEFTIHLEVVPFLGNTSQLHCTLCSVFHALCSMLCALCSVLCALCSMLYTLHNCALCCLAQLHATILMLEMVQVCFSRHVRLCLSSAW